MTASGTASDCTLGAGMVFILLSLALLAVGVLVMIGLARIYRERSVADLLDWKPTRSYETEAMLEEQDVEQMIEAQNEYRRRRGAREITEADVQRQAAEDEQVRARGRGPFSQGGGPEDEDDGAPPPRRRAKPKKKSARK